MGSVTVDKVEMIVTTAAVLWCFTLLVSSLPAKSKIKQKELFNLVDLKFVKLDIQKLITSTTETPTTTTSGTTSKITTSSSTTLETTTSTTPTSTTTSTTTTTTSPSTSTNSNSKKCQCLSSASSLSLVKRDVSGIPVYSWGLPVIVINSSAYDEYLSKYPDTPVTPPTNFIDQDPKDKVPFSPEQDECDCTEDEENYVNDNVDLEENNVSDTVDFEENNIKDSVDFEENNANDDVYYDGKDYYGYVDYAEETNVKAVPAENVVISGRE